jgi:hypothetical protein
MRFTRRRAAVFTFMLLVVGAGAVVGATVSGDISGQGDATVAQSVIINGSAFDSDDVTSDSAVVEVNGQGTGFVTAAEVFQGETYELNLPINSRSNTETTVELTIEQTGGPSELLIDAVSTGQDEFNDNREIDTLVQVSENTFRFNIGPNGDDRIQIVQTVPAHAKPGFYNVTGTIEPIDGTSAD